MINNYIIDKRRYAIRFLFKTKNEAVKFNLPKEFRENFMILDKVDNDNDYTFVRIAQIKLKNK